MGGFGKKDWDLPRARKSDGGEQTRGEEKGGATY